ncbi:hypothetical protein AB0L00_09350 [Actinoallomurus sp. NPDC052308]|uniref:hypothetical protein n=1 Tax=Actinoallomurus sp. NPDC052308 TaxID=3155530 RepID=UPI003415CE13
MSLASTVDPTALPGVRVWVRRVLEDLQRGRSCLCLLPDSQVRPTDAPVERILGELLHELGDFLLLPPAEPDRVARVPRPRAPQAAPAGRWTPSEPLLDYDDGLSDFEHHTRPLPATPAIMAPVPSVPVRTATADLLERLAKELQNHGPAVEGLDDVLARLTEDRPPSHGGQVIVVRAWREASPTAATDLLRRLTAAVKEAGLTPARRPRMLVVATPSGLPAELPDQISREDTAVHWWWGVLGRLDTATVVSVARPHSPGPAAHHQLLESVVQAAVVEVCGPFLDLATELATRWDGVPATLLDELRHVVGAVTAESASAGSARRGRRSPLQPDNTLRPGWNQGLLDAWDGQLRCHPGYEPDLEHTVRTRLWLAQNRVLLPLLDDAREEFTEVIRRRSRLPPGRLAERYRSGPVGAASAPPADGGPTDALMGMELGAMWGAHLNSHVRLTREEADRLRVLWDARNRLAHRAALDDHRLKRLVTELCR